MEGLEQMREKLANLDMENRTLKDFLTAKTAMVEKRKREIQQVIIIIHNNNNVHVHAVLLMTPMLKEKFNEIDF